MLYAADDPGDRYGSQDTLRVRARPISIPHAADLRACRESFVLEHVETWAGKRYMVFNLNFFMNVPIDAVGKFTVVDGIRS